MPYLPLPPGDVPIAGGALPVSSTDDVESVEDGLVKGPETATVRDALREGQVAMFAEYQRRSTTAAGQGDPARATDTLLLGHGADRGFSRQDGETEAAFQERISRPLEVVTPDAIIAIANAILAPYTSAGCRYFESILDRGYTNDGTPSWHAYTRNDDDTLNPAATYPSRLYPDDEAANGAVIADREPLGFFTFADGGGRFFVLRVPFLGGVGNSFTSDGSNAPTDPAETKTMAFWTQNGTSEVISTVSSGGSALSVYQAIADAVNRAVGHSIRWQLIADASLS